LPRAPLGKLFAERLCRFTECFWHSANLLHPVVYAPPPLRKKNHHASSISSKLKKNHNTKETHHYEVGVKLLATSVAC
jgi:hypothetical protein